MSETSATPLWTRTPLLYSDVLSHRLGRDVYLKLENLQPSQSFKFRGLSLWAQEACQKHGPSAHLVIASGGNAGVALAHAAKKLNVRCTVFLPESARPLVPVLESLGANYDIGGVNYYAAWTRAQQIVEREPHAVMAHPYDDPVLFRGHASMIHEIQEQLPASVKPGAILCSVGGAGLIGGIFTGCKVVGWDDVPVVALETKGSNCFYQSILANPSKRDGRPDVSPPDVASIYSNTEQGVVIAHREHIESRAGSLGAPSPSIPVVKMALEREGRLTCVCVPDEMSMRAAVQVAEDHGFMTELACSTTLTAAYYPELLKHVVREQSSPLVFIFCGGIKISLPELAEYEAISREAQTHEVWIDGKTYNV